MRALQQRSAYVHTQAKSFATIAALLALAIAAGFWSLPRHKPVQFPRVLADSEGAEEITLQTDRAPRLSYAHGHPHSLISWGSNQYGFRGNVLERCVHRSNCATSEIASGPFSAAGTSRSRTARTKPRASSLRTSLRPFVLRQPLLCDPAVRVDAERAGTVAREARQIAGDKHATGDRS